MDIGVLAITGRMKTGKGRTSDWGTETKTETPRKPKDERNAYRAEPK